MSEMFLAGAGAWLVQALGAEGPAAPAAEGGAAPGRSGDLFGALSSMLIPLAIIFLIWWVLVFRHEGKTRKQRQEMLAALKKGDTVRLTSGMIGKLWRVDGDEVVVIVDKERDVKARFVKDAVAEVLRGEGKESGGKTEAEGASAAS